MDWTTVGVGTAQKIRDLLPFYLLSLVVKGEREEVVGVCSGASLKAQVVNHLPAMQETWVRFLGQEDPLEKEVATHSSILAWRIPWTEEPDRLQSMGSQESDTT